jgi:nucleotide-binding universal stress UspA family protein
MLPIRTILHPTDFSKLSDHAFELAASLARDYGAQLLVLHVVPPPIMIYGEGVIVPQPENYQNQLREKLFQLKPKDPRVHVDHRLAEGDPVVEILRVAGESNCELIVLGTHGGTGLARVLMGSVAEGVVRKALCPVLTVKTLLAAHIPKEAKTGKAAEVLATTK